MSNVATRSNLWKNIIRFVISFGIAFGIFWYLYGSDFPATLSRLSEVDYFWVFISLILGLVVVWLRAFRWKLLLIPTGHIPSVWLTLIALLLGYLANLVLPRFGEITRCISLRRTNDIPVTISFGTVVTERLLDVFCLLVITLITVLIEFDKLFEFFNSLFTEKLLSIKDILIPTILGFLVVFLLVILIWWKFQARIRTTFWWRRILTGVKQIWAGVTSIFRVSAQWQLWISTLLIWGIYLIMGYVIFFAFTFTTSLDWRAALGILVMGGLAMSTPVQGGLGAYHYLVSGLLTYYGIAKADGLFFAFLLHSAQTLMFVVFGLISLVLVLGFPKKSSAQKAFYALLVVKFLVNLWLYFIEN